MPSFFPVIVPLQDGLGNQMFQYAHGIWLRERQGIKVLFDDRFFAAEWGGNRRYGLDAFVADVPKAGHGLGSRLDGGRLRGFNEWNRRRVDAGLMPIGPVLLRNSYAWQNLRDVDAVAGTLRRAFMFRSDAGKVSAPKPHETVMVHVRRGDYVNNPVFDVCGSAYYRAAIRRAEADIPGASFVVFSENPEWCRQELAGCARNIVFQEPGDEREDLRLMAACRHHILSNSTFSWWAAWLARAEGQRVYCPEKWFNDPEGNAKAMRDLVYDDWTRIGVA